MTIDRRRSSFRKSRAPDAIDIEVGRRIRAQRLARGLSQTQLATAVGITFQQIQKYEKGANRVGAGRLVRLAGALGVSPSFFFDKGEGGGALALPGVTEFLGERNGHRLMRAYNAIPDGEVREAFVDLAVKIAGIFSAAAREAA